MFAFGLVAVAVQAADATSPIDYTQRNAPFAPAGEVVAPKQTPVTNEVLQEKRIEKKVMDKKAAPLGERRAAIEMAETRDKEVREKNSRRPEAIEQRISGFNHRPAAVSTADDTRKPPTVAKYQDSLTAASASNMARFPALDGGTTAKINRFVFRKNPVDVSVGAAGSPVIPAAGGSPVAK